MTITHDQGVQLIINYLYSCDHNMLFLVSKLTDLVIITSLENNVQDGLIELVGYKKVGRGMPFEYVYNLFVTNIWKGDEC